MGDKKFTLMDAMYTAERFLGCKGPKFKKTVKDIHTSTELSLAIIARRAVEINDDVILNELENLGFIKL